MLSDLVLKELEKEGQKIRKAYQRRLPSNTSKDYYFMQRDTGITQPITVEYGFLDNTLDANKLKNNYLNYAEATVRAVLQYIGYDQGDNNTYTVQKGDSLWSIAKKYNISVEELKAANNLTSNLLNLGQKLIIPSIQQQPIPGDYIVYIVKPGDSLYKIANQYNISVDEIIDYNDLSTTNLSVGEQILIPVINKQTEYNTYTVKSGDNLYKIASMNNITVDELMNINNLSSNILTIGQQLLIPKANGIVEAPANQIEYIVKSGDSLYKIANQYGVSVNEIKNYNNLNSNLLSIGQKLLIPTASNITYVVKSGDNLYSIANNFNTTVDEIKRKNNLSSNLLSVGQILLV